MFSVLYIVIFSGSSGEICDERFCNICNHLIESRDELGTSSLTIENARFRCSKMETCCDALIERDVVDENLEAKIKARMKQYIVVGVVGSLFGFAICGAVVLMVKYLIDKHKDTSNFNAMRRQSRARSISDETKEKRRITLATMSSFDSTSKRRSSGSIFTN